MRIIHTDNFGGDYPDERFVEGLPLMNQKEAECICSAINQANSRWGTWEPDRYYRVVDDDYALKGGFEP